MSSAGVWFSYHYLNPAMMKYGNLPNQPIDKLLNEAIAINKDPAVADKLHECKLKSDSLDTYLETTCSEESPLIKRIIQDTNAESWQDARTKGLITSGVGAGAMSGRFEGQFLKMIAEMTKAESILEIGMFTGCGAISFCESAYSKEVISLEYEPYFETFVRNHIKDTPADKKLRIIIGPALNGLKTLKSEAKTFDLVFIDADKINYPNYYKYIMDNSLLRPGGVILVDNALYFGQVYPKKPSTDGGAAVAQVNEMIRVDDRVEQVLLPIRDGVLMVRLKE